MKAIVSLRPTVSESLKGFFTNLEWVFILLILLRSGKKVYYIYVDIPLDYITFELF